MPRVKGGAPGSGRAVGMAAVVALALVAPLVAAGIWVFVASSESPLESAAAPEPLLGAVQRAERRDETTVGIRAERAPALVARTQAAGTLTSLAVRPGDTVASGQALLTVDAAVAVAYASAEPLFRDLARGATGPDVVTAQTLLASLGYLTGPPDGTVTTPTVRAIEAFNRDHGYGSASPVLSLAALVWIGPAPVTVGTLSVAAGDALAPGTALFETAAPVARLVVAEPAGLPDAPLELEVAGVRTAYVRGSGAVTDPAAVAALAGALGAATEGVGTLRRAEPVVVGSVPASAVVADEAGRTCVFPDATGAPIAVRPTGGSLGTVDLDVALVGQAVLLNPREVRGDLTCG